jgi:hypothetical protein
MLAPRDVPRWGNATGVATRSKMCAVIAARNSRGLLPCGEGCSRQCAKRDMMAPMSRHLSHRLPRRFATVICLVVLGLSLAGCTKCGWLWDQGPRTCHSDTPRG